MHGSQRRILFSVVLAAMAWCATGNAQFPRSNSPETVGAPSGVPATIEELPSLETTEPVIAEQVPPPEIGFDPMIVSQGEAAFKRSLRAMPRCREIPGQEEEPGELGDDRAADGRETRSGDRRR